MYSGYLLRGSEDYLNRSGKRNLNNTDKYSFNCGGYALGTFSWYNPYIDFGNSLQAFGKDETLAIGVKRMLHEFPNMRRITDESEAKENETIVLYRLADDDFHFVKKGRNGVYYHKRGGTPHIDTMPKEEVYGDSWCWRYDSEIVILAVAD